MKLQKIKILLLSLSIGLAGIHGAYADETVEVPAHSNDAIGNMLLQAVSLMGIPYKWGGNTPETGMDCSGFIRYVFQKSLGITLPRTAAGMARVGKRVSFSNMEPGDLIIFNTGRGRNTHIGMYLGDNKFIQAPHTGTDIQITELSSRWRSKINGVKRIVQENEDDDGNVVVENYQEIDDEGLPVGSYGRKHGHSRRGHHVKGKKSKHSSKAHSRKSSKSSKKRKHR